MRIGHVIRMSLIHLLRIARLTLPLALLMVRHVNRKRITVTVIQICLQNNVKL